MEALINRYSVMLGSKNLGGKQMIITYYGTDLSHECS